MWGRLVWNFSLGFKKVGKRETSGINFDGDFLMILFHLRFDIQL